jgi:hypothetical protein
MDQYHLAIRTELGYSLVYPSPGNIHLRHFVPRETELMGPFLYGHMDGPNTTPKWVHSPLILLLHLYLRRSVTVFTHHFSSKAACLENGARDRGGNSIFIVHWC